MKVQNRGSSLTGRRVLLIEDEALVSMLLEDSLVAIGCNIVGSASRFDQALEKAKSLAVDVAILDVNLNGQQSFAIAEVLRERGISLVLATGYDADSLPPSLKSVPVLKKPFLQPQLESALGAALGSKEDT